MNEIATESTDTQPPSKEERRVLLTRRTSGRMFLLGIYFSLFTCVAGILLCVFGPWPCTTLLLWFISIPLWELAMGVILLGLLFKRFLYGIKINLYSSAYRDDRAFQQWPEVLAYYPRTFQEVMRVFFILVDTFILNLAFGYLLPITMIHSIFYLGYAFRR